MSLDIWQSNSISRRVRNLSFRSIKWLIKSIRINKCSRHLLMLFLQKKKNVAQIKITRSNFLMIWQIELLAKKSSFLRRLLKLNYLLCCMWAKTLFDKYMWVYLNSSHATSSLWTTLMLELNHEWFLLDDYMMSYINDSQFLHMSNIPLTC
jgi:hypothetical protein